MPQQHIPTCNGIYIDEGQEQCNASSKSWVTQVKNTLDSSHKMWGVSKNVCIYRVQKPLMLSNQEAYVPSVLSFGPYHHKTSSEFIKMDQHKLEATRRVLSRLHINVTRLIEEIQTEECKIRECYEEPIDLDGEALSLMLAMDACFILEFQRMEKNPNRFSLIFQPTSNGMFGAILGDIMKLENQIPLFVLIKILRLECVTHDHAITELARMFSKCIVFRGYPFSVSSPKDAESKLKEYMMNKRPPCHLLDLYRMVIKDLLTNSSTESATSVDRGGYCGVENICLRIYPCPSPAPSTDDWRSTPRVELLQNAGIKFKAGKLSFEKTRFGTSIFSLPKITIVDITEVMLRNLMAYEECQICSWSPEVTVISQFVTLLDELIDSEKDVSILRKARIIESMVGSDEEIARMFNRLGQGITTNSIPDFEKVKKDAREHYDSQWKVWISQFKEAHCSKPWYFVSLVAAMGILGMTAVQTVYSV